MFASNFSLVTFLSLSDLSFVKLALIESQLLPHANVLSSNDNAKLANSFNVIVVVVSLLFNM